MAVSVRALECRTDKEAGVRGWTNDEAIRRWAQFPREVLDAMEPDGDFGRRHLLNPALLRMLGDVRGRRILDAGCGHGYLSRMLAARGARVTGVEPAQALYDYATEKEAEQPLGIRYVQADLCRLPDLGGPFDAVVASMVLLDIPDWTGAMKACAGALAPGGLFVFSVNHPCFEQLAPTWREHGEYRVREYFAGYEIPGPYGASFHRTLSAYLNELTRLGCQLAELAEPALDPATAAAAGNGAEAYAHLPNFLVVAARKPLAGYQTRSTGVAAFCRFVMIERIDVSYCEGWDPLTRAAARPLSARLAAERHQAGEQYAVLLQAGGRPVGVIEVATGEAYVGARFFDEELAMASESSGREFAPGRLFLLEQGAGRAEPSPFEPGDRWLRRILATPDGRVEEQNRAGG